MTLENDLTQMNIKYLRELSELKERLSKAESKIAYLMQFAPMEKT